MTTPGKTFTQIREAPHGAVYVWVNNRTFYPKALAAAIDRSDIVVVPPCWLDRHYAGPVSALVVDHAAELSTERAERAWRIKERARVAAMAAG